MKSLNIISLTLSKKIEQIFKQHIVFIDYSYLYTKTLNIFHANLT